MLHKKRQGEDHPSSLFQGLGQTVTAALDVTNITPVVLVVDEEQSTGGRTYEGE